MKKKGISKITIIIIAFIVLVIAGIISFLLINKNGKKDINSTNRTQKSNSKLELKRYSNSKSVDNLAIPFKTTDGYYVIDIQEENIGNDFNLDVENSNYVLKNDLISISHLYRPDFGGAKVSNGTISINNLWKNQKITIETGYEELPKNSKYNTFEVIDNKGNYYLINSKSNSSSDSSNYYIYISNFDKDYYFKVYSNNISNLENAKELYNKLVDNSKICYMKFDEKDNYIKSTESIDNENEVDTSNWKFVQDMIAEVFSRKGMILKSSINIDNFNHGKNGEISTYQQYSADDKLYTSVFTISEFDEKRFEKITNPEKRNVGEKSLYEGAKEIKIKTFDKSYLYSSKNNAKVYVQIENNFYSIDTGIVYNNGENNEELTKKVINIFEQVFVK